MPIVEPTGLIPFLRAQRPQRTENWRNKRNDGKGGRSSRLFFFLPRVFPPLPLAMVALRTLVLLLAAALVLAKNKPPSSKHPKTSSPVTGAPSSSAPTLVGRAVCRPPTHSPACSSLPHWRPSRLRPLRRPRRPVSRLPRPRATRRPRLQVPLCRPQLCR